MFVCVCVCVCGMEYCVVGWADKDRTLKVWHVRLVDSKICESKVCRVDGLCYLWDVEGAQGWWTLIFISLLTLISVRTEYVGGSVTLFSLVSDSLACSLRLTSLSSSPLASISSFFVSASSRFNRSLFDFSSSYNYNRTIQLNSFRHPRKAQKLTIVTIVIKRLL